MKGISDLALLTPCKQNLNLHISRANYVANMYINATRLQMCLDDQINHRWREDGTVQWADDCFPENVLDVWESCDEQDDDCVNEYKFSDNDEISDSSDWKIGHVMIIVDGKIDVNLCSFNFWKFLLPNQLIFKMQSLLQISTK